MSRERFLNAGHLEVDGAAQPVGEGPGPLQMLARLHGNPVEQLVLLEDVPQARQQVAAARLPYQQVPLRCTESCYRIRITQGLHEQRIA